MRYPGRQLRKKFKGILNNIDQLLAEERPKIERITEQLATVSRHADDTIQNVNGAVTDVRVPLQKDLVELQSAIKQANGLLESMQTMVRRNDSKIGDTVDNLREATDNLNQFTDSLKQRPWSMIRIKQPQDRRVPK